jgi:hypothetical protein
MAWAVRRGTTAFADHRLFGTRDQHDRVEPVEFGGPARLPE